MPVTEATAGRFVDVALYHCGARRGTPRSTVLQAMAGAVLEYAPESATPSLADEHEDKLITPHAQMTSPAVESAVRRWPRESRCWNCVKGACRGTYVQVEVQKYDRKQHRGGGAKRSVS